jgi:ABC-type dipeptide/oligopeptide/nickel transport system permease component
MSNKTKIIFSSIVTLAPGVVLAANDLSAITSTINSLKTLVGTTIPQFLFALALAYFLFGVFNYVSTGADEKKRTEAKNTIIYGVIILFVMSSVWGLVELVQSATGIDKGTTGQPSTF